MTDMRSAKSKLRVLELYSGIGGMHWALKESGVPFEVITAMDINTTANKIYQHSFPDIDVCTTRIEKLTQTQLEKWKIDAVLMSPPCQPFTRVGKKGDHEDTRTQSFLHLVGLLRRMSGKPRYLLVENVKGFEVSETRRQFIDMLNDCSYSFQEFLLSPLQFGIPNARLRYYLIAKQHHGSFAFSTSAQVMTTIPEVALPWLCYRQKCVDAVELQACSDSYHGAASSMSSHLAELQPLASAGQNLRHCEQDDPLCCTDATQLEKFLELLDYDAVQPFLLSDKELRMFVVMDIVQPSLRKTSCFTKRYGRYVEGAGSLLQMTTDVTAVKKASDFKSLAVEKKNRQQWGEAELSILRGLKLRYFTPREVANLLCFPQEFSFPSELSAIQRYRVLGNSLNVHVVSILLQLMLLDT